jgi:predicted TIM-barrel fold metal-dependent hydrolase
MPRSARKVIDAHIHLSERKDDDLRRFAKMNRLRYTLKELLSSMQRHHVEHGLLLSPPMEDGTPLPNEEIIEICERSQGPLSPVLTVEPSEKEVSSALKLAEEHKEVKAFKIRLGYVKASATSPVFDRLYNYAESAGLPLMFHTGDTASNNGDLASSHPLTLDALANKREELTIVICHFGNPWFVDAGELIYKHPNVYADISGLTTGGGDYGKQLLQLLATKISEAVYFSGSAEKIIFGTDYPVTKYSDALGLVDMMKVTATDKERILWRNAESVFRV